MYQRCVWTMAMTHNMMTWSQVMHGDCTSRTIPSYTSPLSSRMIDGKRNAVYPDFVDGSGEDGSGCPSMRCRWRRNSSVDTDFVRVSAV